MITKLSNGKLASAGTNYLNVLLPIEAQIVLISCNNATKAGQGFHIDLIKVNDKADGSEADNIPILYATQDALNTVIYTCSIPLQSSEFRNVLVTFATCDANDNLKMVVGYQI